MTRTVAFEREHDGRRAPVEADRVGDVVLDDAGDGHQSPDQPFGQEALLGAIGGHGCLQV